MKACSKKKKKKKKEYNTVKKKRQRERERSVERECLKLGDQVKQERYVSFDTLPAINLKLCFFALGGSMWRLRSQTSSTPPVSLPFLTFQSSKFAEGRLWQIYLKVSSSSESSRSAGRSRLALPSQLATT